MNWVDLYLSVREAEGRLFPDELAAGLPDLPLHHPLAGEWRARAASCERLKRYLARLARPLTILDLGCGNGWLASQLASLSLSQVVGIDRNSVELAQGERLFKDSHLAFLQADISCLPFFRRSFDVILLASVIQYVPDLQALLFNLRLLLKPGGELHLLDSPLYREGELSAARERTRAYYAGLGFPEMAGHYFHHPISSLDSFTPRWLYHPASWRTRLARRIGGSVSPFPWVCLRIDS